MVQDKAQIMRKIIWLWKTETTNLQCSTSDVDIFVKQASNWRKARSLYDRKRSQCTSAEGSLHVTSACWNFVAYGLKLFRSTAVVNRARMYVCLWCIASVGERWSDVSDVAAPFSDRRHLWQIPVLCAVVPVTVLAGLLGVYRPSYVWVSAVSFEYMANFLFTCMNTVYMGLLFCQLEYGNSNNIHLFVASRPQPTQKW